MSIRIIHIIERSSAGQKLVLRHREKQPNGWSCYEGNVLLGTMRSMNNHNVLDGETSSQ